MQWCSVSPGRTSLYLNKRTIFKQLFQRIKEQELEIKEKNRNVTARDKVITELRLRLPATKERDEVILRATAQGLTSNPNADDYESQKALKIAHSTVSSLQVIESKIQFCSFLVLDKVNVKSS